MLKGVDISNWQKGIIPHTLGVDFCIAKATEGVGFVDPCCDGFIQDCIAHKMLWGFYHFNGTANPLSEAEFFVNNTRNYFGHGIPVLDYEVANGNDRRWAEKFMKRVHDLTGIWPMLYTSASWLPRFEGSWIPEKCGLWLAGYPYAATTWRKDYPPYSCSPWDFVAIWQFTSSLQLGNWPSGLDGDIAYMDADAWGRYANSADTVAPEPVQPTLSYIELIWQVLDGKWGYGADRIRRLDAAGYDGQFIQDKIDEYYDVAYDVIAGKWGNGWNRREALQGAGYDYELVQRIVNAILDAY